MPKVRPLTRVEAMRSLAHRIAPRIDRVRQVATNLGTRPYRVFLVWTAYAGTERGEGPVTELRRIELLPTPLVEALDQISLTAMAIGAIPVGMIRIRYISATFTEDQLTGHWVPEPHEPVLPPNADFFYEIREDGRGDPNPVGHRYRLAAKPHRQAGEIGWRVTLERLGTDNETSSDGTGGAPCSE